MAVKLVDKMAETLGERGVEQMVVTEAVKMGLFVAETMAVWTAVTKVPKVVDV